MSTCVTDGVHVHAHVHVHVSLGSGSSDTSRRFAPASRLFSKSSVTARARLAPRSLEREKYCRWLAKRESMFMMMAATDTEPVPVGALEELGSS